MWLVVVCDSLVEVVEIFVWLECESGLVVFDLFKEVIYYVGLYFFF